MMQELLNDPQTLPFLRKNTVCQGILKKQIDRRIAKIRLMLGGGQLCKVRPPSGEDKACQTHQKQYTQLNSLNEEMTKLLSPNNSILNLLRSQDKKRSSLPVSKKKHRYIQSDLCAGSRKDSIKLSEYLSVKKLLDSGEDSGDSNQKKFIQTSQDDKIFTSNEFDLIGGVNSCSVFRHSQNIFDNQGPNMHIPLRNIDSDEEERTDRSGFSNSFICHRKNSNYGSKAPSTKKIRFTDRTAADATEKRFIPSEECQARMLVLVDRLLTTQRREGPDCKLRENILRKIDQKYGVTSI